MDKKNKWSYVRKYFGWGVTIVAVSALVLLLFFCFYKFSALADGIHNLVHILMPIIYGMVIAYLLSPIYNWLTQKLTDFCNNMKWHGKKQSFFIKSLSMLLTFSLMILIIVGLIALLVPSLIESITNIINTFPSTLNTMTLSIQRIFSMNAQLEGAAMSLYVKAVNYVESWLQNDVVPQIQQMFSYFTDIMYNTIIFIKNLFIGIIVAVYILANKKKFASQSKKLMYAVFGIRNGNFIMDNVRYANNAFGGFLGGKIVDSAIIGVISWIALSIMHMPYALIQAVVIGVTNIIPFFGPFIGAVPCAVLTFMVSPIKTVYLLIFILILQQFDGNILGPKILGETTGVSSFWVLFSIILFGGLFGFVGMIIGVPLFAVLSHIISDLVEAALEKKNLPKRSEDYVALDYIDAETQELVRIKQKESIIVNRKEPEKPLEPDGPETPPGETEGKTAE